MKKIISIVLVLAMVLLLGGCGASEKDALLGTWRTEMDLTEMFNESMVEGAGEEFEQYLHVSDFTLVVTLTFNADDTFSMVVDETALNATMDTVRDDLQAGLEQYLMDIVAAAGVQMSIDDILAASGISMDALMDEIITQEMIDTMISDIGSEGRFKAEEGKLFLSAGLEYDVDENIYEVYTLDGTTLTLLETISTEEVDEFTKSMYPMVFHKVN